MSALERMLDEFAAQPDPAAAQRAAAAALREGALPTRHDENWHYADLRAIESVPRFTPAVAAHAAAADAAALALPAPLPGFTRLVLCDGRLLPASVQVLANTAALQRLVRRHLTLIIAGEHRTIPRLPPEPPRPSRNGDGQDFAIYSASK